MMMEYSLPLFTVSAEKCVVNDDKWPGMTKDSGSKAKATAAFAAEKGSLCMHFSIGPFANKYK